ncbi:MAG: glycosyltransferase, partial [Roseiflexaceae bacterium]|nr:glycosyltransferase [Roseiflexaceae bacterium]
ARYGLAHVVRFLTDIADTDLPALYAGAELFAYPSRYEGFGLPPLEALACGTPVLCGNTSSLPEVMGDAALLVDVTSVDVLAASLLQLLGDADLRGHLRAQSPRQAARFSWRRTAELTLRVYEGVARTRR